MEKAIKKAIEGGWDKNRAEFDFDPSGGAVDIINEVALLDSLFWQALGKAEGWLEEQEWCRGGRQCRKGIKELHNPCVWELMEAQWKQEWHSFIDHLASGGDIDFFFNNLLK